MGNVVQIFCMALKITAVIINTLGKHVHHCVCMDQSDK